jgi:hypothetical protein
MQEKQLAAGKPDDASTETINCLLFQSQCRRSTVAITNRQGKRGTMAFMSAQREIKVLLFHLLIDRFRGGGK